MGSPHPQAAGRKAGAVPVMTVDLAALFAELADSRLAQEAEALTTGEIVDKTGRSLGTVKRMIGKAQAMGLCESTRKPQRGIDGVVRNVQAYTFKGVE